MGETETQRRDTKDMLLSCFVHYTSVPSSQSATTAVRRRDCRCCCCRCGKLLSRDPTVPRARSSGDGVDGVETEEDKLIARFWHQISGVHALSKQRREIAAFKQPGYVEAKVLKLHKFLGDGMDVPM